MTIVHPVIPVLIRFLMVLAMIMAGQPLLLAQDEAPAEEQPAADEPTADAPAAQPGASFVTVHIVLHDQLSYREHPFFLLTGNSTFKKGNSATGNSFSIGRTVASDNESIITQIYRGIPSFGIEFGQTLPTPFPRAFSFGFDHIRLTQTDKQSLDTDKSSVTIPRVSMDSFYDLASARVFAFDLDTPGINYFLGIGLGRLTGVIQARPYAGADEAIVEFSQTPVGVTRFGLEARGENFGFRYEVNFTNADEVKFVKNPFQNQTTKVIDFTGVLIRVSLTYTFNSG